MRSPTADPRLESYSIPEAALVLGISDSHAYRMAREGKLPGAFQLGRRTIVNKHALLTYMARLAAHAAAAAGSSNTAARGAGHTGQLSTTP